MNLAIRFACPHCGQHYSAESLWQGRRWTCVSCQAQFLVPNSPANPETQATCPLPCSGPETPAGNALRTTTPKRGTCQLLGTLCGICTPAAALLIALPFGFLGHVGYLLAAPAIAYLSHQFAKRYLSRQGPDAFAYYFKAGSIAFLLLPVLGIFAFLSVADEAAGLVLVPVAVGSFFVAILLAGSWLAGVKWFGPKE